MNEGFHTFLYLIQAISGIVLSNTPPCPLPPKSSLIIHEAAGEYLQEDGRRCPG
jgi:hypothetical protein